MCSDTDGCAYEEYQLSELRPYSAKELAMDLFFYYHIEEISNVSFYSAEYVKWLRNEANIYSEYYEVVCNDCKNRGIDIADLPSKELWEFDRSLEIAGWLEALAEVIENEITEVAQENPQSITIPVPDMYGRFAATASADPAHPGIDVEFVPDTDNSRLSNPRILLETGEDGVRAYLWTDGHKEDYTLKVLFG